MNVLEKAEKSIEYLKNNETSAKSHELQAAAGTLGRCLGALGSRQNYSRQYANLLHSAIPSLLALASNDSAEVRLVGDEALNRAVVGGFAFHAYKTNVILQNNIDHTKNARWLRAALSRICLGENWLRPGVGKIRSQAQNLFPKLSHIVRQTDEIQLVVETLENNLPRILNALAEYTTDEEIMELSRALLRHLTSPEAGTRRGVAGCLSVLCRHRDVLLTSLLAGAFENLWPRNPDSSVVLGWFGVIKSILQGNGIAEFTETSLFTVQDYLELYHLCIHYIEESTVEHNIQNAVMECLSILVAQGTGECKKALLEKHPKTINLDRRVKIKGHSSNISGVSAAAATARGPEPARAEPPELSELRFRGSLLLGELSHLPTPRLSVEDLTIQTPESPTSGTDIELDSEQLTRDLAEKLKEYEANSVKESENDSVEQGCQETGFKVNIGTLQDDDIPLKYCARLLISKFILTGNKGCVISDRSVRVSVKSSALNCLSEILQLYPQAITMYVDKDADIKSHNISGSTDGTDSNQDNINDFILERNVCYQDSLTDSLTQDLLNKSIDSHTSNLNLLKKQTKTLEKCMDSVEQKSTIRDVQSNIFDSKIFMKNDLIASGISADSSNPNMTNSNFTSNSNMTGSFEPSCYPMSSSGEILSSSIDLDMKFDHFGDSHSNVEAERPKRPLRRTDDIKEVELPQRNEDEVDSKEFVYQHMSELFVLLCDHNDPQIRGLVRVCVGSYLNAALDISHGDFYRWKNYSALPKDVSENISTEKLVDVVLKGLSDTIHSCVSHTLTALTKISVAMATSSHYKLLTSVLNSLVQVENNKYWLCKINLCKLYEKLPYRRLFMLLPGFSRRCSMIMDSLYRLLADEDQRVRHAAANTIALITPKVCTSKQLSPTQRLLQIAVDQSKNFTFETQELSLDIVREMHFYHDLPDMMKVAKEDIDNDSIKLVVCEVMGRLMRSSCKFYSQGLIEALHALMKRYPPWNHIEAYSHQGILEYCLDQLDCCNGTVTVKTLMIDLCTMTYPVEIHNTMRHRTANRDIFERDKVNTSKWQHLDNASLAQNSEKYQTIVLRMLNVLVHLIEEVNPASQINKGAFPGSPVRRNTDTIPKKTNTTDNSEEKSTLKRKPQLAIGNLRANFVGNFYSEPFYLKFYDNLRAAYSNHKINLDAKSSIFYEFLTSVLDALSIQLELSTEREFGYITEELLYYMKTIMPLRADKSVYCVTQLLKCLFSTNMINQYNDFMSVSPKIVKKDDTLSFYDDVLLINKLNSLEDTETDSRRGSVSSNSSQKISIETKNPRLLLERQLLIKLDSFSKNKSDRKWGANKKELERYIRLFEPVVIQSLKSYTMQNDVPLQCKVLCLLNQLLTLRVNYCMLDSDQIFIGFLFKQMDLIEQHEIPNCIDLVSDIMLFLVHLSASKHHSKQIIELPKLIQLCDGLLASGAEAECVSGLQRVSWLAFSAPAGPGPGLGPGPGPGPSALQQRAIAREVLQAMLNKCMHTTKTIDLVSCVLALSQETFVQGSAVACDTLLSLLSKRTIEIDDKKAVTSVERLIDYIYKDVLLEQSRVEMVLKILFQAPPPQTTTPFKHKLRYLSIILVLLRKVLVAVPESEILLSINYLKSTHISPQSIFFNVKNDIDPLNVHNVNETCANLSPDVILVRLLFKTLTYAIIELDNCHEKDCANLDLDDVENKGQNHRLLYSVCVSLICQVKHMLHLTNGCIFPLTAKTAQNILQNEQSGLNTGLYSPEENIPLELLNLICLRSAHRIPLLTVHWSHLLIRLKFLEQKYWQNLLGFVRHLPLSCDDGDAAKQQLDLLQVGCFMAYCEYFVENGLSAVVQLTWLVASRIHALVSQVRESLVLALVRRLGRAGPASGLLLQAAAARCHLPLKGEFALNLQAMLSEIHVSQSGPLIFLICRVIGKLEPSVAVRFAKLAIERCRILKEKPVDEILVQLNKEDVQVALEMLQRDKVHIRYPSLVLELNSLASSVFDLSPLDLSQERAINPQYILSTSVDAAWLVNVAKNRCCQTACTTLPKVEKHHDLATLLSKLPKDDVTTIINCQEFDRKLLNACLRVACDNYISEFVNIIAVHEGKQEEIDRMRQQREAIRMKEEQLDNSKLNNTLHVFKKSDSKESKSQFFIPIVQDTELNDKFGNLQITEDETELVPPSLPDLYLTAVATFDSSLTDVIRLFPKQNRPLSQSENFKVNIEQSVDRYTRRCHQVFQDKLFHQEFMTMHTVLAGYLECLERILNVFDEIDCDIIERWIDSILPASLAKNIAGFSVISLQYLSFLIKNKELVESPVNNDVSFRVDHAVSDKVVIENVIAVALKNVSKSLTFTEIWQELDVEKHDNKTQSAICCLYAIVKYFVKDTKPLVLKSYLTPNDQGPKSDIIVICDKLLTLIEYWETNIYKRELIYNETFIPITKLSIENLIIILSRLDVVSNIALIPPMVWPSIEVSSKKEDLRKIELPLTSLEDMDVLEEFLFRANLIGWRSRVQFSETWVAHLSALGGAGAGAGAGGGAGAGAGAGGAQWAARGMARLLLGAAARGRHLARHLGRAAAPLRTLQRLRTILVGTSLYNDLFECINLERIPLVKDECLNGYHYAQFNDEFVKFSSEQCTDAPYKVRLVAKRLKKMNEELDLNSCLQLLVDVAANMLEPKAGTGAAARAALRDCVCAAAPLRPAAAAAAAAAAPAKDLPSNHQRLLKSLSSTYPPTRQSALQDCLAEMYARPPHLAQSTVVYSEFMGQLKQAATQCLGKNCRISLHEQTLYWAVIFALIEFGHPDLISLPVDFLIENPRHYCTDLVVKGITMSLRQQVLPKELKNTIIEKLLDNMKRYSEHHATQILMVHLFSADDKLLSPKLTSDVSNMDPDVLMNSMERITLLYRVLRESKNRETKYVMMNTLKYFLRETLPPAATLSRVVIEFVESCKVTQKIQDGVLSERERCILASVCNARVVFEVFETAIAQDQLNVLSGWIFEALCHLLSGKITNDILPHCLILLLISASSNDNIRQLSPLTYHILRHGFDFNKSSNACGVFKEFLVRKGERMSFSDRRLLCIVAMHSRFTQPQLERLKELCDKNPCLNDLLRCLTAV